MSARRSVDPFSSGAPHTAVRRADGLARAHGPPAATRAAVLLAALAALAAGGWRRPCGDGEIDIPVKRTVVGVFQFLGGWNVGSPKGSTGYAVLNFAALADGTRVQCRTDWGLLEQLKIGRPYQCSIDYRVDTRWLTSAEEYNLQPWELRPRVYEVEEMVEEDLPGGSRAGLRVRRLGASTVIWVPQRRTEGGRGEPVPEMLETIRRYPPGEVVEINCRIRGKTLFVRTIRLHIPLQRGHYQDSGPQRIDGRDRMVVSVRTKHKTWTLLVEGRFDASGEFQGKRQIVNVLEAIQPGQEVTFTAHDDDGHIWLESLRPVEEKRAPSGDRRMVPARTP